MDVGMTLLMQALAPLVGGPTTPGLQGQMAAAGWSAPIRVARATGLDGALAKAALEQGFFRGLPEITGPGGDSSPPLWARQTWAAHVARRAALRGVLVEIVGRLNAAGHVPVVLKGARSLWTGGPELRAMRDLDILVPGKAAAASAQKVLVAAGFTRGAAAYGAAFHHEDNLYRADLPGWVEIHRAAAAMRAEGLLGSAELARAAVTVETGGARALVLPAHLDLIHNLAHHHFGHWEAYNGVLDPKGLFEFALALAGLDETAQAALVARLRQNPLLLAMTEFWLVAAAAQMGTATRLIPIGEDVRARWKALRSARSGASRLGAIWAELSPALSSARLQQVAGAQTRLGRLRLRAELVGWAARAWGHYYLTERWMP